MTTYLWRTILFASLLVGIALCDDEGTTTSTRKERFLLATLKFRNHLCSNNTGVCKSWKECWISGGRNVGACSFGHGVCCTYTYTCGNTTSERVSYFVNPAYSFDNECRLQVNVYDRRVTQLRLDFEDFRLSQPTLPADNEINFGAYRCQNDSFTVSSPSANGNTLGFRNLCGMNSGQHIYVPVNATLGPAQVSLIFNRGFNTGANPSWRIKITQIDCCAPDTKDLCAPDGCLQYYPAPSGTFESFNYNGGMGPYQGLLNYAICFKRYNRMCSIQYMADRFALDANNITAPYGYQGCKLTTISTALGYNSSDYLFIPDAHLTNGVDASLFCYNILQNFTATTNAPGPMYVFFRSDDYYYDGFGIPEIGFRIRYQESNSGCYNVDNYYG